MNALLVGMLGAMNCLDCGKALRLVLTEHIDAEIQETGAAAGNRVHNTHYRCESCGAEFEEDDDGDDDDGK